MKIFSERSPRKDFRGLIIFLFTLLSLSPSLEPFSATSASGQQSAPVGQVIWNSVEERSKLKTGCFLTYDLDRRKLRCAVVRTSAYFDADALAISKSVIPALTCPNTGAPCRLIFSDAPAGQEYAGVDFLLPDAALTPEKVLVSIVPDFSGGQIRTRLDWCTYPNNTTPCVPTGDHMRDVVINMSAAGYRSDGSIALGVCCIDSGSTGGGGCLTTGYEKTTCKNSGECTTGLYKTCVLPTWNVNDHVVMLLTRLYNDVDDSHDHPVNLEGIRVDFRSD